MEKTLRVIDSINTWVSLVARWLIVGVIVVIIYEVTLRKAFDAPTIWAYETSMMLGGAIAYLSWGYVQMRRSHIRIDIFYNRMSPRGKALVDIVGALVFFFPFFAVFLRTAWLAMLRAWKLGEVLDYASWYPPAAPFRTLIVIGTCLVLLQFIAQFTRDVYTVKKGQPP
jgi:TRAP-type mannitol/chloroaromatic compound transport system permease small subunit